MPTWITLQWETESPKILISRSHRGRLRVEKLITPVDSPKKQESAPSHEKTANETSRKIGNEISRKIDKMLNQEGIGKGEVVVVLGRSDMELRPMKLPPVSDEELPELVHFQAMREFHAYDAEAPVDFIPLDNHNESPRKVLSALLPNPLYRDIHNFCDQHNLRLRQIVLRPCAAASLWNASEKNRGVQRNCLLIDLFSGGADISLVAAGRPRLLRSMRLPAGFFQKESTSTSFLDEVRRTAIASRNELHGEKIDAVILFGTGELYRRWAEEIGTALKLEVEQFNPCREIQTVHAQEILQPDGPSHAALLGATQAAARNENPFFDFCHPRKKEESTRTSNLVAIGAMTVLLVLAMLVVFGFYRKTRWESDVRVLAKRVSEMEDLVTRSEEIRQQYETLDQWREDEIYWLGELDWLSRNLPPAEEVLLTNLNLRAAGGAGEMKLQGRTKSGSSVALMEWRLRDQRHRVVGGDKGEDRSLERYPFRFDASVLITDPLELPEAEIPEDTDGPVESLPSPKNAEGKEAENEIGGGLFDDLFDETGSSDDSSEVTEETESELPSTETREPDENENGESS